MPFCANCGKENIDTAKFCTGCGSALTATAVPDNISANNNILLTRQRNPEIRTIVFWGAVMVFIGFFLPWHKYYKIRGIQLAIPGSVMTWMTIAVDLILLPSIIIAMSVLTGKVLRFARWTRYVPLAILILLTILYSSKSYNYNSLGNDRSFWDAFFEEVGIGFILVIIGSIMMCFYNPKNK